MPTPITRNLGLNISPPLNGGELRKARLSKGWTLRQVSHACADAGVPVDDSNLSKAERTGTKLGPRKLAVLLAVLPALDPETLIPGLDDEMRQLLNVLAPRKEGEAA